MKFLITEKQLLLIENKLNLKSRVDIIKKDKEDFIENILKGKVLNDISANDLGVVLNIDEEKGEKILNKICDELKEFKPYLKIFKSDYHLYNILFKNILNKPLPKNLGSIKYSAVQNDLLNRPKITFDDTYFYFLEIFKQNKNDSDYRLGYYLKWNQFKTIGELINYIKINNQINEGLNLKSRGKKQSEERNLFAKEILNKNILDVKQTEYNILKSEEKKEIIQKFIDFLKKEFEIKVGYGTITHDLNNVHFSYFLEKKDLYYKFYNLEDFFMFSIGLLAKTRQEFSDIVQASETPFKTISNLIKLSIEKYLKSLIKENLNLKSRAKEQRIEKERYINSILSKPIETISFEEIEKLQSLFYGEKIHNRIMDKIFFYLYNKYLKEENFSINNKYNYIRIDFYKNDIRHIIDLSMDNFYGTFYLNHWNSKEKVDNYTNFDYTSYKILKDMFDYLKNLIKK
jgi:hypothetical protein